MTDKVNLSKGKEMERLQAELADFIVNQMSALMAQGWSVMEIQDVVRAAVDIVPQTYAPDAEDENSGQSGDSYEILDTPVNAVTYFLPMDEADIAAFSAGEIEPAELMELICELPDITAVTMPEGLDLILTDFGKSPGMENITEGGEIVAGADGEAFMPEFLEMTEWDGYSFLVCEPMAFKTAEEVKAIAALLVPVDEKEFRRKADIKKLIKSGWLDEFDKASVKKEAGYIIGMLWEEFAFLCEVYQKAAAQEKGMAVFAGYEGNGTGPD
ncbi:MAG: YfbM family protein [Methanosarcinales archaeon]|nr:YfbM family protein [Methanosarcinales archaeon]